MPGENAKIGCCKVRRTSFATAIFLLISDDQTGNILLLWQSLFEQTANSSLSAVNHKMYQSLQFTDYRRDFARELIIIAVTTAYAQIRRFTIVARCIVKFLSFCCYLIIGYRKSKKYQQLSFNASIFTDITKK